MARPRKTGLDWVRVDVTIVAHEKVFALAQTLNISTVEALGYYIRFLCWVAQHHADNDLTLTTDGAIDSAVGWTRNSEELPSFGAALRRNDVRILTTSRRGRVMLNGWDERNGNSWKNLQTDRDRKKKPPFSDSIPKENPEFSASFPPVPYRTVPEEKNKDVASPPEPQAGEKKPTAEERRHTDAAEIVEAYKTQIGRPVDKTGPAAKDHIVKLLKTHVKAILLRCVERYAAECSAGGTAPGYRFAVRNFFGKAAVYSEYLADLWTVPEPRSSKNAGDDEAPVEHTAEEVADIRKEWAISNAAAMARAEELRKKGETL
jgi:hypothetical protein